MTSIESVELITRAVGGAATEIVVVTAALALGASAVALLIAVVRRRPV